MKIQKQAKQRPVPGNIIRLASNPDITHIIADTQAEEALIGAVLQRPELFPTLNDHFNPEHFYWGFTRLVWYAMQKLSESGDGIDISTIPQKMREIDPVAIPADLSDVNLRLAKMVAKAPRDCHPESYQKNINRAALRAAFLNASDQLAQTAMDVSLSEDALMDTGERILFEATQRQNQRETSMLAAVGAYFDRMEKLADKKGLLGIPTGYPSLDGRLGGLIPGNVNVLAGSEGMGKTTMMLSMIRSMCKAGIPVVLFTLEMTQEEIIQAFVAMETGINKMALKTGGLASAEWQQFTDVAGAISQWPLHIVDEFPALTPLQLRRKLRRIMADQPVQLVAVDGLWLMEPTERTKDGRFRDVFLIMRDLTDIAKAEPLGFYVPILITHQYNSEVKNAAKSAPNLYWLSESSGVRRNAQVVLAMHRAGIFDLENYDPTAPEPVNLYILKDRNGRAQGEKLTFNFEYQYARYVEGKETYDPRIHYGAKD